MISNIKQLKGRGANLPIVSDEVEVQRNSMRLYVYLVSISNFNGANKPRLLYQKDFTVNKIREMLGMHPTTIKKYWHILEDNGLIKYEGKGWHPDEEPDWNKYFMSRKKDKTSYYTIPKQNPYRIMPMETIKKIQYEYLVDEQELKLYLLLAEMQERFCYMQSEERCFTIADLRGLLSLKKHQDTNKALICGLIWLKKLGLIDYNIEVEQTNLGGRMSVFYLKQVNYYTNGGEIAKYLGTEGEKVSEQLKTDLLKQTNVDFYEE